MTFAEEQAQERLAKQERLAEWDTRQREWVAERAREKTERYRAKLEKPRQILQQAQTRAEGLVIGAPWTQKRRAQAHKKALNHANVNTKRWNQAWNQAAGKAAKKMWEHTASERERAAQMGQSMATLKQREAAADPAEWERFSSETAEYLAQLPKKKLQHLSREVMRDFNVWEQWDRRGARGATGEPQVRDTSVLPSPSRNPQSSSAHLAQQARAREPQQVSQQARVQGQQAGREGGRQQSFPYMRAFPSSRIPQGPRRGAAR
jgi:hypothetical protein